MSTRFSRFALPIGFFGLAVLAWVALGKVAVSDIGPSVANDWRRILFQPEIPTHPVLGWTLFAIAVVSFICGLSFLWRLFKQLRHEGRA